MAEVINSGIRKVIKNMCVVAQTAQFVSLMPKPKDFVTRIIGDVVYLSAQVNKLSEKMNKLLDDYANIPTNYLMTQMNSITGSLSRINDRLNVYTQNAINQTIGLGENTVNMITDITGNVIDITGSVTNAVVSLGSAISETSANIIGQPDVASGIHDSTESIFEWTNGKLQKVKDVIEPVNTLSKKITDAKTGITDKVGSASSKITDKIEEQKNRVKTLITELREKMDKLSNLVDTNFKDVTGLESVSNGAEYITDSYTENGFQSKEERVANSVAGTLATVINNFSIGKAVFAFMGVLTQSVIVRTGLDQLPPIDFESMLYKIREDASLTPEDLARQYNTISESTYREMITLGEELAKIPSEERNYSEKNYDEFVNQYEEELKEQREKIRNLMKFNQNQNGVYDAETKKEIKTAIKEVEKYRNKIKNAKRADTFKTILGKELDNFRKEVEFRSNSLKSDWMSAMKQYRDAIAEIKEFFTNGGSCDMFINDCCDKINKDFDGIKELCKNLATQLISSTLKAMVTSDISVAIVPNPVYKLSDFLMDIKTILKFIKDLIVYVIDIINHINKLARIMLNGINNLKEIIDQFMKMFGLTWLMNLIKNILDMFRSNIKNVRLRLENSLSPVYLGDTKIYEETVDALTALIDDKEKDDDKVFIPEGTFENIKNILDEVKDGLKKKDRETIDSVKTKLDDGKKTIDNINGMLEELDNISETIVAYKSPIIKLIDNEETKTADITDGDELTTDMKFIGWHFFHPNLYYDTDKDQKKINGNKISFSPFIQKIKSKIIRRAAKTGNKERGGINGMKSKTQKGCERWKVKTKNMGKISAYDAFYWFTYYTEDMEKDCFEWTVNNGYQDKIFIDNIIQSEYGSVVNIGDGRKVFVANNMVRKGDFVTVNGIKYKVI